VKQLCDEAIGLLESGESFVQATILTSSGSVPRGAGACMLCLSDGSIKGTVGGGALEAGIIKAAPAIFESRRARVIDMVLDGNDAVATGMICGGSATVLMDYIDCENKTNLEFFEALLSALKAGVKANIVTVPPPDGVAGMRSQCLLPGGGAPIAGKGIDADVLKALGSGGYDVFTKTENHRVYMHRVGSEGTAYIFGAGHCGEKLAPVLSSVGFRVVVIDDRDEFANESRFPGADEIMVPESIDRAFGQIQWGEDSYIVIVTRGHMQDEIALRGALKTNAGYVGMIGSNKKRESIYQRLLSDGYVQTDLDRVFSPVGIEIGADTPEEIAVSIAAEMINVRFKKRARAVQ